MHKNTSTAFKTIYHKIVQMAFMLMLGLLSFTSYAQYCAVTASTSQKGVANFVTTNGITNINNATQPGGSYSDYSAMAVSQFVGGQNVNFTVTPFSGSHGIRIWIDWNNNFTFDTAEMVYNSNSYVESASGTITIPAGTPVGSYRMRVVANWLSSSPTACGTLGSAGNGEAEDYTFAVIAQPTCMPPNTLTVTNITEATAQIGWSAVAGQNSWEVLVLPTGSPAPTATATGYATATTNSHNAGSLQPNTTYDAWVRSNCGATDGKSMWIGPKKFMTTQVPHPIPYTENFEGTHNYTLTNTASPNKWFVGTAVAQAGTKALYVSNDVGVTNAYTTSSSAVIHAYRDLIFPANTSEVTVDFNWKGQGESTSDYLRVWLMPSNYQPVAGTAITPASGGIQVGAFFNLKGEWQNASFIINAAAYSNQIGRLVFEWTNDSFSGTQPPAAVDNVAVKQVTCPRPTQVISQKNNAGNIDISWVPSGTETQWEIIIQPAGTPAPTDATNGTVVNGSPHYLYTEAEEGVIYEVYVRAVCGGTDKSKWTQVVTFSDFNPPACAQIDLTPPNLEVDGKGDYFYCEGDGKVNVDLDANFDASKFKATTSYTVESIPFEMPFPTTGGIKIPGESDDIWSAPIHLPFDFCFYGNNYNVANVGTNGLLSFAGPFTLGTSCSWSLGTAPIPSTNIHRNAIMVFHDIDRSFNKPKADVNYQVLGTYPCRALVVSFNDVPYYDAPPNSYENTTSTFQIVIYEITNIIEIYVKRKPNVVGLMSGPINGGRAVMGIQNATGTVAEAPPGRNTGVWEAVEEAWRFSPSGETDVTFSWYANGQLISNNSHHSITIEDDTDFKAVVSYPGCGAEDLILTKEFTVKVSEEPIPTKPKDIHLCVVEELDLTSNDEVVISKAHHPEKFDVEYYLTEADAIAQTNAIPDPEHFTPTDLPQTIHVRMQSKSTECFALTTLNIILQAPVPAKKPNNIVLCVYDDVIPHTNLYQVSEQVLAQMNPAISTLKFFNSFEDAKANINEIPNPDNYQASNLPKEIFVLVSDTSEKCDEVVSFSIVEGSKNDPFVLEDFEICTNYVLPELPSGFYYSSERLGQGKRWNPGEVLGMGTHRIFVNSESKDGCISTGSYEVTVISCFVAKGISPNGDGLNDAFDLTKYRLKSLSIFNRYGKEVFSYGPGYTNQWVGQDKGGNLLPDGTYFYRIVTATEDLTGYIQLVREVK